MARWRRPRALSERHDPTEPFGRESAARGLAHENNGCCPTAAAACLDFHTGGAVRTRGGALRHKLANPNGSTPKTPTLNLNDVRDAWRRGWGQTLHVADELTERTWAHIDKMAREGRMVIVNGDSGLLDGACSEGQDTEHSVALHPDRRVFEGKLQRLIMDPWCYRVGTNGLGRYRWIDNADLKRYAAAMHYQHAWTQRRSPLP